jgi:D-sedoheptulose 7-phosphate isomerase
LSHVSLEIPHAAAECTEAVLDPRGAQADALVHGIDALCAACVDLAQRIAAGGRLWVLGAGRARADARHLALEFLHPVIVGKRAVPACALDPSEDPRALARLASPGDVAIAVADAEPTPELWRALAAAQQRGLLAIVLGDGSLEGAHHLDPGARDPLLAKEGRVATYHLLWELTHAMLEQSDRVGTPDAAWSQLYPFLGAGGAGADSVRADLRASGVAKLRELARLRTAAAAVQAEPLARCADAVALALD